MSTSYCLLNEQLTKLHALRRIVNGRAAAEAGLYFGQLPVLEFIQEHPSCTQKDLADALRVTPASIALSTKRLQKAGLIEKRVDAENLRCNRLSVTPTGRAVSDCCREKFDAIDAVMFAGLDAEQLALFDRVLTRIAENITREYRIENDTRTVLALAREMRRSEEKSEESNL